MHVRWGSSGFMSGVVLALAALLAGCNEQATSSAVLRDARALPADAVLAQLYGSSCQQCHASAAAGAPLTGDITAWAPRLEKGMERLLDNTINGIQGMPPMGQCVQCTVEEFSALIEFMAAAPSAAKAL